MKYRVGVARLPERGWERQETVGWLIRTIAAMRRDGRIDEVVSLLPTDSTPAPMLRNEIVVRARAANCDYLLSVDSDMVPDLPGQRPFWPTAWEFMMDRRRNEEFNRNCRSLMADVDELMARDFPPATIAAPYCGPSPVQCCYVFQWASHASGKPDQDFRLEMVPRESAAIRAGIQEAAALPTGLILYDMRVFDRLPPPWYEYEYEDEARSRKATTEDVYQTRNASLLGLPQYCAWDCWAGHLKSEVVGRPTILTRDHIHSSLVEAVKRGIDSGDRLIVLGGQGVRPVQGVEAGGGVPREPEDGVRAPVLLQGVRQHGDPVLPAALDPRAEDGPPPLAFDPMDHEVPEEDLEAIGQLAWKYSRNSGRCAVEVGAWAGRSTLVLAEYFKHVFAVDHWQGSDRLCEIARERGPEAVFRTFCRNMGDKLCRTVFPCRGTSESWARVWTRPIDFLYIDGDHRYSSVLADIQDWLPHVRPGGLVVCHDHGVFPGVTRAVEELIPHFQRAGRTLAWWEKS